MADYTFGVGEELQFATQDTDLIHTWNFGDGSTSTLPNPSHIYSTQGTYIVTHLARDFCDTCATTGSHTVDITLSSITVKSILLDKYTAKVGDIITVTVVTQNLSPVFGSSTISIDFGGDILGPYNVTLSPGQETTFSVDHQVVMSGMVNVCADNVCTALFVESQISVKSVTATPSVSTGETITISVTVKNDGTFTEQKVIDTTITNQVTIPIDQRTVTLAGGESQTFNIPLDVRPLPNGVYTVCANGICKAISIAISAPIGNINITSSPSGTSILLDGNDTGFVTPFTLTDISTGNHNFTLKLPNYNDVAGSIDVLGGMTSYVYVSMSLLTPTKGSTAISSVPTNAQIFLAPTGQNPTDQGVTTPATISDLDLGDYDIILRLSGYQDYTTTVPISAGQTTYISAILLQTPILIGSINFTSVPDGAEIWLENISTGNLEFTGKLTNNTITGLDIGNYGFELRLIGYNNLTGQISVLGGVTSYVYAVMVSIAPTVGGISIISTPPGADIYLDGVPQLDINDQPIRTPATIPNLIPGTHGITLKLSGYEDYNTPEPINIVAGITTYLDTILTPIPITIGSINFTSSPSDAQIWLDGNNTGRTTPDTLTNISIGTHTFIIKKSGYNNTTGPITVIGGTISYVYAILSITEAITGSLSISSVPTGADIYIDGVQQLDINNQPIRTPNTISNLTPGTHNITLKLSGYEDFNISTNIVVGQTSYISVSMIILPSTIGNINFTTIPDNVEMWLDDSNTGKTTPNTLTNISIGTHTFILKKSGYDNATGPITVIGGVTSYIYAVMVPVSAITGSLSISSIPQNADIYLDGVLQLDNNRQPLKTPATLMDLDPGAYTIKLKKTGYIDFTTPTPIDVIAGQTSYLGVTLSTLQVMEAGMPWWFVLSLATGTIYGMLQPKKEKIISKLGRIEFKT